MPIPNDIIAEFLLHAEKRNKELFIAKFPRMDYEEIVVAPGEIKSASESIDTTYQNIWPFFRLQRPWDICFELLKSLYVMIKHTWELIQTDQDISDEIVAHLLHLLYMAEVPEYHPSYYEEGKSKSISGRGGKVRSQRYLPAKKETARLLKTLKPEDGWSSITAAINGIDHAMKSFITNTEAPLNEAALPETLRRWMKNDDLVKAALEETLSEKARLRLKG